MNYDAVLRYWRSSLADGALGAGKFKAGDQNRFDEVPSDTLNTGRASNEIVAKLFKGQPKNAKSVSVRFWPMVAARQTSHGAASGDDLPQLVAPVVTMAHIDREGRIHPQQSFIARDLLTPQDEDKFTIGSLKALDDFLTTQSLRSADPEDWQGYQAHYRKMFRAVAGNWPEGDENYRLTGFGFLEAAQNATPFIRGPLDFYDKLLADQPELTLLPQIAMPDASPSQAGNAEAELARRLGHSNPHFPLSAQQRQVLACLDAADPGNVIAVNGPPGTGKTTLILSAVAGLWVAAALKGEDPPVIVAASTNNQAVTNIIDAFGKDFATGEGPMAGRWLPGIESFGMFLPAWSRKEEAAQQYHTEEFQTGFETEANLKAAKEAWLQAAGSAFPDLPQGEVATYVAALQKAIGQEVAKLAAADRALTRLNAAKAMVAELGPDPQRFEAECSAALDAARAQHSTMRERRLTFDRYHAEESIMTALFSFLPAIGRKRVLRARLALGNLPELDSTRNIAEIEQYLASTLASAESALTSAEQNLRRVQDLRAELAASHTEQDRALDALGGQSGLEDRLDCGMRFDLFRLATHYWEGRWLMAMEADLTTISASATEYDRATVVPRWQRRMMLTPCAVATFASLPTKISFSHDENKRKKEYLYNFIDLLIVDEAGQVLPEAGGAAFALAKRALVIGDTRQLEPIANLPRAVDIGNLREAGLLAPDADIGALDATGICSSSGSIMRMAQMACRVSPWPDLGRGLWLFEHRRCYDEIIGYSNTLCYRGNLRPMRGAAPKDALLPAMGFVHIEGRAIRNGSSRSNPTEARTIAAWADENRERLVSHYQRPIEEVLGIVTPFSAQVFALKAEFRKRKIGVSGSHEMTIGTVHSLQGAERPVVIFSPVYCKQADGPFIDASTSLLNVTVSRAKDSFLVFGDMDLLSGAMPASPRALLSNFLDRPGQEIFFRPEPRADLQDRSGQLQKLQDATEHDQFLLNALSGAGRRFVIVSPWIKLRTMERTGILAALQAAVSRGAVVDVYSDPLLNADLLADGSSQIDAAEAALKQIGVTLHRLEKLHSKIVTVDSDVICVGSFNWLSADRQGQFARHETSYVYRGDHLEQEIRILKADLKRRGK